MVSTGSGGVGRGYGTVMSFGIQAISGRWFMVYGTILIMSMAGPGYIFGTYSEDIKSSMGYSQSTLNLISFFKNVGANVGFHAGLLMLVVPPWVVLATGGILNFFGYFMIWLAVTGKIVRPAVWKMCLYICIGSNSAAFTNTAALSTCVMNFPESRGAVIGLLTGFLGLSGAIITQIYQAIYGTNSKSLILLIAWLPALVSFAFLRTIRVISPISCPKTVKVFYQMFYMSLVLTSFIVLMIILQLRFQFPHAAYVASAFSIAALICLPLYTVIRQELNIWKEQREKTIFTDCETQVTPSSLQTDPTKSPTEANECFQNVFQTPERGEDYTILQALFSIDMLLIFMIATCCFGGTLTAIDNLGQIGTSLGYPQKNISTFLSLVSIWNYLGRVTSGFLSDHFLSKYKIPRPLMLTFVLLLSCLGHLLIAFGVPNGLYFASFLIGFCFGAQWPLIFASVSEIFGLKYYSTLFNIGVVASPIGAYIFEVWITGSLYDKEANRQFVALGRTRKIGEEINCNGVKCFKMAFLIITGATMFAVFLSLILSVRTKKFYQCDIHKNFRPGTEIGMARSDKMVKMDQEDDAGFERNNSDKKKIKPLIVCLEI